MTVPGPFDALKTTSPASHIACAIAAQLLNRDPARGPYRLSINHDVSAAGCRALKPRPGSHGHGACPFSYTWQHDRTVGVEMKDRRNAERWIVGALLKGYTVARLDRRGWNEIDSDNLEQVRHWIAVRASRPILTPEQRQALDDEIPF